MNLTELRQVSKIKDVHGINIEVGMDIVYIAKPEKIYTVIELDGIVGHTVKYKNPAISYQSRLLFLPSDNNKVFEIINTNTTVKQLELF